MVGSLCNSAAEITHCCNTLLGLFISCSEIIPRQIPLSAYVVVTPVQHPQLPNHTLKMFHLLFLQLTPKIPMAGMVKCVNTFLGFIVCFFFRCDGVSWRLALSAPCRQGPRHSVNRGGRGQSGSARSIRHLKYISPLAMKKT